MLSFLDGRKAGSSTAHWCSTSVVEVRRNAMKRVVEELVHVSHRLHDERVEVSLVVERLECANEARVFIRTVQCQSAVCSFCLARELHSPWQMVTVRVCSGRNPPANIHLTCRCNDISARCIICEQVSAPVPSSTVKLW